MCCFSGRVAHVSATRIFARATEGGRQVLAYAMRFAALDDVAMVLPLPVPAGSPEGAVRFVDLSEYPHFFDDLARAFPALRGPRPLAGRGPLRAPMAAPKLEVQEVGDFEASFVPTAADFARLDERFRLPPTTFDALPAYADFGFAVFKLRAPKKPFLSRWTFKKAEAPTRSVHPMAFEFPRRDPSRLFFPTVHIHDGEVHDEAHFDHELYWQSPTEFPSGEGAPQRADAIDVAHRVKTSRTGGLVRQDLPCYRQTLQGVGPNRDTVILAA